jgi:hypothetical protein
MRQNVKKLTKRCGPEPLFIRFANFHFTANPVEDFFEILEQAGIEVPIEELLLYYRTEDEKSPKRKRSLTNTEKERISQDLESDRLELRNLLKGLRDYHLYKKNLTRASKDEVESVEAQHFYETCIETLNDYCSNAPVQFIIAAKDSQKLELGSPSTNNIEEIGWRDFPLTLMAMDLGKYLLLNPITKIKFCAKEDCGKFFTRRGGKAVFCSDACKKLHHYISKRDSGYFRNKMKEGRSKGKYQ